MDTKGQKFAGVDRVFLSDLAKDATEQKNLAKEHPDVVERLTRLHDAWAKGLKKKEY